MGWTGPWGNKKRIAAFWRKVEMIPFHTCWEWIGSRDRPGYGRFWLGNRYIRAHRFAYKTVRGYLPRRLVTDHLCRNASCVNPDHLEMVLQRVNVHRGIGPSAVNVKKTHCPRGHVYDKTRKNGRRSCSKCDRAHDLRYSRTHKEEAVDRMRRWCKQNPRRHRAYRNRYNAERRQRRLEAKTK